MNRSLLCLLAAGGILASVTIAPAAPKPPGNRYLFIVETSTAMQRLEQDGRQAFFDLLQSGLRGHMRNGDTFGIWTYGKDLHAGLYPMQAWGSGTAADLASHAVLFIKSQKYEKRTRLDPVYAGISNVVHAVKDLHVFVISASGTEWSGTPFDLDINTAYRLKANQVLEQKRPLITTLTAANGQIVDWSVTLAGDSIRLPERPVPVQTVQKPAPPPPPVVPPPTPRPIIMTGAGSSTPSRQAGSSPTPVASQETAIASQTTSPPKTAPERSVEPQEPPAATAQTVSPPKTGEVENLPSATPAAATPAQPVASAPPSVSIEASPSTTATPQKPTIPVADQPPSHPTLPNRTDISPNPQVVIARPGTQQTPESGPGQSDVAKGVAATAGTRPPPAALKPAGGKTSETLGAESPPLAGAPASQPFDPSTGQVAPSSGLLNPMALLVLGLALALVGVGLIAIFLRRYRLAAQMSYITRSMEER